MMSYFTVFKKWKKILASNYSKKYFAKLKKKACKGLPFADLTFIRGYF